MGGHIADFELWYREKWYKRFRLQQMLPKKGPIAVFLKRSYSS